MNIGIDIDGVLNDLQGFNQKYAPPFFKRKFGRDVADDAQCDIRDIFKCPDNEWMRYWRKYLLKYATIEPARDGAGAFVKKLVGDGHEVYIISKRAFSYRKDFLGKLMRAVVRNWLKRNGIQYSEVIFCDHDDPDSKKTACVEKLIDVLIDDDPVNIVSVAPIARVICFDATYNRECDAENTFRAKDFEEAYCLISQ